MLIRKVFILILLGVMLGSQLAFSPMAATYCDHAQFVSDISVLDGTNFAPRTQFTKTWRLKNIGTCTWTTSYKLEFVSGDPMGSTTSLLLPVEVPPGQMIDLSVNLIAPNSVGHYRGNWMLKNENRVLFGIGAKPNGSFWVDINVEKNLSVVYDFVANAQFGLWRNEKNTLPFPGVSGDNRGYASIVDKPLLENNSLGDGPGLLMVPQNVHNGIIQAVYSEVYVEKGDRFQSIINCEVTAKGCAVTFRLDYMTPSGTTRTLWSAKESNDGKFARADVDLSLVANQNVRFVLTVLATGYANEDRALWGSPRIVRSNASPIPPATHTPLPPATMTPTPFSIPPVVPPYNCDRATLVSDVTIPNGSIFTPGTSFTKTWRLRNDGTCEWTGSYKLIFYNGNLMGAPTVAPLQTTVLPGQTVDVSVDMVAPVFTGNYKSEWYLSNSRGQLFGQGEDVASPIVSELAVSGPMPGNGVAYDFVSEMCIARWYSEVGDLPCPSQDGNPDGYSLKLGSTIMEEGSPVSSALLMFPQDKYDGYVQGVYPFITVQPGDRFQAAVGCEYGSDCSVTFRLDYKSTRGQLETLWAKSEILDNQVNRLDLDLSSLAGQTVQFVLTVLANGYSAGDRALWGAPRIYRPDLTPPTLTPVVIPTSISFDWPIYTNSKYGFQFQYPKNSKIINQMENSLQMQLPFTPGTNLVEKYLDVAAIESSGQCRSPQSSKTPVTLSEALTIHNIPMWKEIGDWDAGAGHKYRWTAFSAVNNGVCVSMTFYMHSIDPGTYSPPLPVFDEESEKLLYYHMMQTFTWLYPKPLMDLSTPTPTPTAFGP